MRTLLNELSNLKEDHEYTIIINGVCSYISCRKENIKLSFLTEKQQEIMNFELLNEKTFKNLKILRFGGNTSLTEKELLDFLLQLTSYQPEKDFTPKLVTIVIYKTGKNGSILWEVDMEQSSNGRIFRPHFLTVLNNVHYSIIGDFYFINYYTYQERLTELYKIWVNDRRKSWEEYQKAKTDLDQIWTDDYRK